MLRMGELFHISLDELVKETAEETSEEPADPAVSSSQPPQNAAVSQSLQLPLRKIVGIALLSIACVLLLLLTFQLGPLYALLFSAPFLLCGGICLLVKNHPCLWCFWSVYLLLLACLRPATGIRLWWVFLPVAVSRRHGNAGPHCMGGGSGPCGSDFFNPPSIA